MIFRLLIQYIYSIRFKEILHKNIQTILTDVLRAFESGVNSNTFSHKVNPVFKGVVVIVMEGILGKCGNLYIRGISTAN